MSQWAKILKFTDGTLLDKDWNVIAKINTAGSINAKVTPELIDQMAGPSMFPIASEVGNATSEVSVNFQSFDSNLLRTLVGGTGRSGSIVGNIIEEDVSNAVLTPTALFGKTASSTLRTDTGLHVSSTAGGIYRFDILSASRIRVTSLASGIKKEAYTGTNADYAKGIVGEITWTSGSSSSLSVTNKSGQLVGLLQFTAGTTAPTTGHRYLITAIPTGSSGFINELGEQVMNIPEVRLLVRGRNLRDGRWMEVVIYRLILPGVEFNFANEFGSSEVTGKALFDQDYGQVMKVSAWKS